ncbi:MAG: hypothetical protein KBT12_02575 [Bacteroidales bacterium]|nr:hypothetical protein [Candidatus Physcousia equi]
MEGKDSICKLLKAIEEVDSKMKRELLIDYMTGSLTPDIESCGLDNTELFGCGDDKEEEHWELVVDHAIDAGFLKLRSVGISLMSKGKKYLSKPVSFELEEKEEDDDAGVQSVEGLVENVLNEAPQKTAKSVTSQRKLALIQAVDRHVALDDFASNHSMEFDEVMDDAEALLANGTKLDVTYFGVEVLGEEAINELCEYFDNAQSDNIQIALDEMGDVYTEQELRLGRFMWRSGK